MKHTLISMLENSGYQLSEAEKISKKLEDYPTDKNSVLEIPKKFSSFKNPTVIQDIFIRYLKQSSEDAKPKLRKVKQDTSVDPGLGLIKDSES